MPRPSPCRSLLAVLALLLVGLPLAAPAAGADEVAPNPLCDTEPGLLCLLGGRFEARVDWKDQHHDREGAGVAEKLTDRSGTFWFFHPDNVEMIVKVLDGRPVNGDFWVFVGAMTDVEFFLVVRDRETGFERTYHNPPGRILGIADTDFSSGTDGALCGTIVGIGCDTGFFCDLQAAQCGGADLGGVCTPIPGGCPTVFDPVCGCDGRTYGNDCERRMAGVQLDHEGACDEGPTSLQLAVGESRPAGGLTVSLLAVENDSRCPVDVTCVWQGDATARVRAQGPGTDQTFDLHLTLAPRSRVVGGFRVTFEALEPEPRDGVTIPQSAYRATFLVEPD